MYLSNTFQRSKEGEDAIVTEMRMGYRGPWFEGAVLLPPAPIVLIWLATVMGLSWFSCKRGMVSSDRTGSKRQQFSAWNWV